MKLSYCLLACGFLFASFYSMMISKNNNYLNKFTLTLTSKTQKEIYQKIQSERLILYLQGQILGLCVGLIYLYYMWIYKQKQNYYSICYFILISHLITILYYANSKKTLKMIDYLTTQEQKISFEELSIHMKNQYMCGFLFGIAAQIFIWNGLFCF